MLSQFQLQTGDDPPTTGLNTSIIWDLALIVEPLLSRNTWEYSNPELYNLLDYLLYIYKLWSCQQSGFRLTDWIKEKERYKVFGEC